MRFFSVYGAREQYKKNYENLVTQFLGALYKKEAPVIYGYRFQKRDFVLVDDVVNALELAMKSEKNGIYNVGTGKSYSLNDMMKMLTKITNKDIKAEYIENLIKKLCSCHASEHPQSKARTGL
ncbi:MAG: NAD-dependent epimerase/dehydratase family protein [Candidatus Micrarchaeia archaeon]